MKKKPKKSTHRVKQIWQTVVWPERIDPRNRSIFLPRLEKQFNVSNQSGRKRYMDAISDLNTETAQWLECEAVLKVEREHAESLAKGIVDAVGMLNVS